MSLAIRGNNAFRFLALVLAALILVPGIAVAQTKQVSEIKIVGNEHITNDAILAAIALKPGMPFTDQSVQQAQKAIQSLGYFERVVVGTESMDSGVRVVFNVVENPVVKEINITGNTVVTTEKIRSLMLTPIGGVLNMNTLLQKDIPAIEGYYGEQGYIAYVTEQVGIDPKTGVLSIPIQEIRIAEIKIVGNEKTRTYVILREMTVKPGDVFNRNALFSDLRRIYDLDIFDREAAEPYRLEAVPSDPGKVTVTIPVKERKTGEVSVGVGYSTQNKLVGQAKMAETNFQGKAQTINMLWEQSATNGSSLELGFFEPWLDTKHTSLGVNLYDKLVFRFGNEALGTTTNTTSTYDERRRGGSVTLSRPLNSTSRGFFTARSESVTPSLSTSIPSILTEHATVSSGTLRYTSSNRDSEIDPVSGTYNSLSLEGGQANTASFGRDLFTKVSADLRHYFSRGGPRKDINEHRPVLAARFTGGTLAGNVPFFEQYFLGGAETLRGYKEDRFWGRNMVLGSVEYRQPFGSSLTGVAFVDAGDAWGASPVELLNPKDTSGNLIFPDLAQHSDFEPQIGYGLGIRVSTPIGPLRLDYGFSHEGSRAHFSIGHVF